MKKFIWIFFPLFMSCSHLIDPPKNLISKDQMSELVAEFVMTEQINIYVPGMKMEDATRLVLKNKKIQPNDFTESFKYYTATGDLEDILNNAQKIILEKDPEAKIYIEKNLEKDKNLPPFAR